MIFQGLIYVFVSVEMKGVRCWRMMHPHI